MNRSILKDLTLKITDGEHGTIVDDLTGDCYLLSNKNIVSGRIVITKDDRRISRMTLEKIQKRTNLESGNIVIATVGTIGRAALIKDKSINYDFQRSVGIIRCNESKLLPEYLYYSMNLPYVQKQMMDRVNGGVQKCLYIGDLENLEIDYFDIPIQKKITSFLSSLDAKIELNNRINTELEVMAKTLYDYWFVQFDFPDENGDPYKSCGGNMVWSEQLKREIPGGWEVKKLDECIETIIDYRGKTPKKLGKDWSDGPGGVIALSAKHVKNGQLINLQDANRVDDDLYNAWMKEHLREGDILMTSEAPCGEFFYLIGKTKYCLSQRLFAIRANSEIVKHSYLYYELSSGHGNSQILGKVSGSTVFGIRQDELRTVNILIPNKSLQKKFSEIVEPIYRKIRNNDYQNQQLSVLRDWLLPMLMNGQVTVKDVNDKLI